MKTPARRQRTNSETGAAHSGSQKWLQLAVARRPDLLQPETISDLDWLSPVGTDGFREFADGAFLDRLDLGNLRRALAEFWPSGGPRWDGLARAGETVILVEAKAHIREFLSLGSAAKAPTSIARINSALHWTKEALGADDRSDWARVLYQYANRLAHLCWLRSRGVDAHLLLVGFVNDKEMGGVVSAEEWKAAYMVADHALGLPARHPLRPHIMHVFPDVGQIAAV